jgi:integrase/recombinase XerC/integrase/recombinase XerD
LEEFIASRLGERGLTAKGEEWLRSELGRFLSTVSDPLLITRTDVERFLGQCATPWTRHSHFRAIRAFYNWAEGQGFVALSPCHKMAAPRLPSVVLSHPSAGQVATLIATADNPRDKAIISLFADTGLRVTELAQIAPERVDWERRVIRVYGKGRKERLVKFGPATGALLATLPRRASGNIWGIDSRGIQLMLLRLGRKTGITANPHSFRRFFAIELRKRGVDSQTIQYLGGWESLAMVERYSRAAKQEVALAEYVPLADTLTAPRGLAG